MKKAWWKEAIVYQIYPRSFMDTSGDGNGDINGIIRKLDYIQELGCNAIWISPFFDSPMVDNGYDISNYLKINPIFGSMEDFDKLILEAEKRNIAIIIDAVFNHTSNKHKWFIESKKNRSNKYSDYYIWRDKPINKNSLFSVFSDSPWTYIADRNQYYFHIFAIEQPDLNWKNPSVRKEMANVLNFWIQKGVKGFRFDVLDNLGKDPDKGIMNSGDMLHSYIQELRQNSWSNLNLLTVAEVWSANDKNALLYCGDERKELTMIFQFEHIIVSHRTSLLTQKQYSVKQIKQALYKWQNICKNDGWNSNFFQNHDLSRVVSAWGDDNKYWYLSATCLATLNHLLKGTPYIYQGEEIGMTNCHFEIEDFRDVQTIEKYKEFVIKKKIITHSEYLKVQNANGRDHARTPMQWDDSKNAGFSSNKTTWLKVNSNYKRINVKAQEDNKYSILSYYKKLIFLRKQSKWSNIIIYGNFVKQFENDDEVFHFKRKMNNKELIVLINWSNKQKNLPFSLKVKEIVLSNYLKHNNTINLLRPYEAIVLVNK